MKLLNEFWKRWRAFGRLLGDFIGRGVMMVFYFSLAVPFGLGVRTFSDPLQMKAGEPHWQERPTKEPTLQESRRAF